jgi:hypothetical protein
MKFNDMLTGKFKASITWIGISSNLSSNYESLYEIDN